MFIDENLLQQFEAGLNPQDLENSRIPASIIGYGEISAIFQIAGNDEVVFKRLPFFSDRLSAEHYIRHHDEYCRLLSDAGLCLPEHTHLSSSLMAARWQSISLKKLSLHSTSGIG